MLENNKTSIKDLYDFEGTLAGELLNTKVYPWEVLPQIAEYIFSLGKILNSKVYTLIHK